MLNEIVVFNEVEAQMAEIEAKNASLIFDYDDPQGNSDARSHIFKLRKTKTAIAAIHKDAKAEALAVCRTLDEKKNGLIARVDKWIKVHNDPIQAIAEKERIEDEAKVAAILAKKEKAEQDRLDELQRREADVAAKEAEQKTKQDKADLTELNRLADIQHEADKLAAVEEAKAKAEQNAKDALEKAECDKELAVETEKEKGRKIEADRLENERIEAENKAAVERLEADVERKRVADTKHRKSIEDDIYTAMLHFVDVGPCASAIVAHMKNGEIPHITINY